MMSKAVLISIRPEWCEKIINGQKTIKVSKTRPKIETPFKCYIYCTKPKRYSSDVSLYTDELYRLPSGEIKFGSSIELSSFPDQWNKDNFLNGKVIGEFICDEIYRYTAAFCRGEAREKGMTITDTEIEKQSCLTQDELYRYENSNNNHRWGLLGWHISDLVIYDKPKSLYDFIKPGRKSIDSLDEDLCKYCSDFDYGEKAYYGTPDGPVMCEGASCDKAYQAYLDDEGFTLYRPPQGWCYVEEL